MNPRYEDVINKQRTDEGKIADFEASSRKWGQNIGNGIVEITVNFMFPLFRRNIF
jgi:hypothetical protein